MAYPYHQHVIFILNQMNLTGIILAGGKSTRMGQDKGLILLNKKPMIEHVIHALKPHVKDLMIITGKDEYRKFGYPIHNDLIAHQGPIGGICTGLHYSTTQKNIILSCDTPFINSELLELMILNSENHDAVFPENNGQTHPLIGIYNRSCLPLLKDELRVNQRKLKFAIEKMDYQIINTNHLDTTIFKNINTKNDLNT